MIHFRDSAPIDSEFRIKIDVDGLHTSTYAVKIYEVMEQEHIRTAHCNQCDEIADKEYDYLSGSDLSDLDNVAFKNKTVAHPWTKVPKYQHENDTSKSASSTSTTFEVVNDNSSATTNQQPQIQNCCGVTVTTCHCCKFQCGHGPLQLCANMLGHIHISERAYQKVEEGKIWVKTYTERENWLLIYDLLPIHQTLHDYCWGCRHG